MKEKHLHIYTARKEMQSFRSCPSMLVLHSLQVQGMCWENKSPWSLLLPTLHPQCLSLLDTFVLLSVEWFPACAHFSSSWKESRWGDCPTPSVFLRSHPAYRYSCIMLGSLSGVWLNLNTSFRFLSSQFSAWLLFIGLGAYLCACLCWQRRLIFCW